MQLSWLARLGYPSRGKPADKRLGGGVAGGTKGGGVAGGGGGGLDGGGGLGLGSSGGGR